MSSSISAVVSEDSFEQAAPGAAFGPQSLLGGFVQVIVGPAGILELTGLTFQGRDCGGLGGFGSSCRGHLGTCLLTSQRSSLNLRRQTDRSTRRPPNNTATKSKISITPLFTSQALLWPDTRCTSPLPELDLPSRKPTPCVAVSTATRTPNLQMRSRDVTRRIPRQRPPDIRSIQVVVCEGNVGHLQWFGRVIQLSVRKRGEIP